MNFSLVINTSLSFHLTLSIHKTLYLIITYSCHILGALIDNVIKFFDDFLNLLVTIGSFSCRFESVNVVNILNKILSILKVINDCAGELIWWILTYIITWRIPSIIRNFNSLIDWNNTSNRARIILEFFFLYSFKINVEWGPKLQSWEGNKLSLHFTEGILNFNNRGYELNYIRLSGIGSFCNHIESWLGDRCKQDLRNQSQIF